VTAGVTDVDFHNNLWNNLLKAQSRGVYGTTENTGVSVYVKITSGLLLEGTELCLIF
jgi:hypothetical protein